MEIINPSASTPQGLYGYAKKERIKRQYDFAFCVFDGDVNDNISIEKDSDRSKLQIITSIPCFEIWLLVHFTYTSREFCRCNELINGELKKYIPGYEKTRSYHQKKNFYKFLRKDLMAAVRNAKRLDSENQKSGKTRGTTSAIYKIIESIKTENS